MKKMDTTGKELRGQAVTLRSVGLGALGKDRKRRQRGAGRA